MPLDRLVLILVIVLFAAAGTIWLAAIVATSVALPLGWIALIPLGIVAFIAWRVISDRLNSREDDHYDRME